MCLNTNNPAAPRMRGSPSPAPGLPEGSLLCAPAPPPPPPPPPAPCMVGEGVVVLAVCCCSACMSSRAMVVRVVMRVWRSAVCPCVGASGGSANAALATWVVWWCGSVVVCCGGVVVWWCALSQSPHHTHIFTHSACSPSQHSHIVNTHIVNTHT